MSGESIVQTVSLNRITRDRRTWPREALDEERVAVMVALTHDARDAAHARTGGTDPLPPLVVVADGQGGYLLADGHHRYEARRRLGPEFDTVTVDVYPNEGRPPAELTYELALRFATVSAKPLTTAEKRAAIERLLSERPDISDRAIARLVGVSHSTVGVHRAGVVDSTTRDPAREQQSSQDPVWLSTKQIAEQLVFDFYELRQRTRKLLGFGEVDDVSAGRKLAQAFAECTTPRMCLP
ncbi:MAG: hypothetical protein JO342_15095 [Solirubrobacterales bacterium]|nr:hypothetical protein [Solirubrobacterales bacterium]